MKLPEGPPLPAPSRYASHPSSLPPSETHLTSSSTFSRSFCLPPRLQHNLPRRSFLIFCPAFWQTSTPPDQDKAAKSRKTLNCLELPCESKQIIYPSSLYLSIKHSLNLSSLLSLHSSHLKQKAWRTANLWDRTCTVSDYHQISLFISLQIYPRVHTQAHQEALRPCV